MENNGINISVPIVVSLDDVENVKSKLLELIELEQKAKSLADDLAKVELKLRVNGLPQN